jgi:hypothetical protein
MDMLSRRILHQTNITLKGLPTLIFTALLEKNTFTTLAQKFPIKNTIGTNRSPQNTV